VGPGIKPDDVRRQGRGNIGKAELVVHAFTRRQGIGQLIFMKIDQGRGALGTGQRLEIDKTHQARRNDNVVITQVVYLLKKV